MPCKRRYSPKTRNQRMSLSDQILKDHPDDPLSYVISVIKKTFPEFSIERKKDSWVCKIVAVLIYFFNKKFMKLGTFAFMKKVYVPENTENMLKSKSGRRAYCSTLTHEFTHMLDQKKDGQLQFSLAYLFPQNLAILALLALGAFWWLPSLFALGFLVALAPWGAKYRLKYEIRGYAVGYLLFESMFPEEYGDRMWEHTLARLQSPTYYSMTRHSQAWALNDLLDSRGGPFLYPQIEKVFRGLDSRGHFYGD